MKDAASLERMSLEQDRRISEVVKREQSRLRNFIRRRVPDPGDAEDILQEVFYELVEANRLLMPIEHVTGWMFRVARNRITDLFRKKKPVSLSDAAVAGDEEELLLLEDLLPSPDAGPDAVFARSVLLEELEFALDELPAEQRAVFVGHELDVVRHLYADDVRARPVRMTHQDRETNVGWKRIEAAPGDFCRQDRFETAFARLVLPRFTRW